MLGTAEERDFTLDLTVLPIYQHDLSSLDEPFSEEEVWMTIKKNMLLDKSPRTAEFTGRFYRGCWSNIKGDVLMILTAIQCGHVFKFRLP